MAASETNVRTLPEYEIRPEQEHELMIRYAKEFTREHVFAVDLMVHTMETCNFKLQNYIFPNDVGRIHPSDLDSGIMKLIGLMVPETTKKTKHSVKGMTIDLEDTNYEEFKCFANAVSIHFKNELYEYPFLGFCIGMASMCCVAHKHGMTKAPYFGIMLMCRKFPNYLIKGDVAPDPWQEMRDAAKLCAHWYEMELRRASV